MKQQTDTVICYDKRAFTLTEMLIVIAILGILAAIVLPEFQTQTQQAKEASAKDNLRIFRNAVELYAAQHNGVPPGYFNGDITATPSYFSLVSQLRKATNSKGQTATPGTVGFPLGPYIKAMPSNPFNNGKIIEVLSNDEDFPTATVTDPAASIGWIYKPSTKEVRINQFGTDSRGVSYQNY